MSVLSSKVVVALARRFSVVVDRRFFYQSTLVFVYVGRCQSQRCQFMWFIFYFIFMPLGSLAFGVEEVEIN